MGHFYSATAHSFYTSAVNGKSMPSDAVEITREALVSLLAAQRELKVIVPDERGFPIAVDPGPPSHEQLIEAERAWRDGELASAVWLRERHRDQLEIEVETTLTAEQFKELLVCMQALRDWPQSPDFPQAEHRPVAPSWIAEQTQ